MALHGVATVVVLGIGLVLGVGLIAMELFNPRRRLTAHGCGGNDSTNTYVHVPTSAPEPPRRRRKTSEKVDECVICRVTMIAEDTEKLKCGHFFHIVCITKWFNVNSANKTCPICRARN